MTAEGMQQLPLIEDAAVFVIGGGFLLFIGYVLHEMLADVRGPQDEPMRRPWWKRWIE